MNCPTCGAEMRVRTNRSTGSRFWGCSTFPDCRGTAKIDESLTRRGGTPVVPDANPEVPACTDRLPKTLSPSRASDFVQCPRMYYEKAVTRRVVFQASDRTTRGTLTHHALERVFDLPAPERTPANAVPFVRSHWEEIRGKREQAAVAALDENRLEAMLDEAEESVRTWFTMEDPTAMEPEARELEVTATLGKAPMRGFIDRLDLVGKTADGEPSYRIVDYKTGKPPDPRFLDKALFPVRAYAAAVEASRPGRVEEVRLVVIGSGEVNSPVDRSTVEETTERYNSIWDDITTAAATGRFPCRTSRLCDWCDAKPYCPAWGGG